METTIATTEAEPASTLYGKLIGVIADRRQLQPVCDGLSDLGVREVEVLDGPTGVKRLEASLLSFSNAFLGDMEANTVKGYLNQVTTGLIVFVATVVPETADQAADTVQLQGATQVVHFGNSVITNYPESVPATVQKGFQP